MPSTATITAMHTFAANTLIRSSYVNANFSNWRGHLIPITTDTATAGDANYDVGSTDHRWQNGYFSGNVYSVNTSTGGVNRTVGSMQNARVVSSTETCTAADDVIYLQGPSFTEYIFHASGNPGKIIEFVHDGTTTIGDTYGIDAAGSETIDGTTVIYMHTKGERYRLQAVSGVWKVIHHFAETQWQSFGTLNMTANAGALTKGTTEVDRGIWKREGRFLLQKCEYLHGAAGAAGTGNYQVKILSGVGIDTSLQTVYAGGTTTNNSDMAAAYCGEGHIGLDSSVVGDLKVYAWDSSTVAAYIQSGTNAYWTASYFAFNSANLGFSFVIKVPISGWKD